MPRSTLLRALAVCLAIAAAQAEEPAYDFVLRGGRIIDGSGNPAFHGDLAVKGGRIAAIGKIAGVGKREIAVAGMIVAPGFIDVHTHAEDIEEQPLGENFLRMGVTTIVLGNCGSSALNVGEFFQRIETATFSPNVATLVGHGAVRRAMEDGAVGLATGLIYLPGTFAKTEEIIDMAKVAAEFGGIYATHQRSESGEIFQSLDEIFRIGREARLRVEISHLKLSGPSNWGKAAQVLAAIEKARAEGLDITQDQYAYTASSTGISQLVPEAMREGGDATFRERLADAETKAKYIAEMKRTLETRGSADYAYAVIAAYKIDPSLNGLNIAAAAGKVRPSRTVDEQIELIFDIVQNGGATGVFHGMSEADLAVFMQHPNTMFASDSGVRRWGEDVPHPRGYGNNARVLAEYVREKKILRIEDAVRRMTSLPARTFHFAERGELLAGNWADITVFDPEKVADPSTYADPHHYATGFRCVFVKGTLVVESDTHTGARPGQVLRRATP